MCGTTRLPRHVEPGERRWTLADTLFLGLVAGFTLPAALVRYPLSADYLNHLARLHILGSGPDAPIRQFYEIRWGLIPNLGVDLLWAALHEVASPEVVIKGALIGAIVALGLSVWFLHRSLFARTQPTILLCAFCLLNLPITAGFLNFALGLPLVFLALGCWIRMGGQSSGRALVLLNLLGVGAYFAHLAALGALALTITAYHCLQRPLSVRAALVRAVKLIPCFLAPALLVIGGTIEGLYGGTARVGTSVAFTATKLFTPLAAFFTGNTGADIVMLCATIVIVILCRGPISPRLKPVLAVWTVIIVAIPSSIGTAVYIDARLVVIPVMLYLSSIAFQPTLIPGPTFSVLATSLAVIRVLTILPSWQLHDEHVRSFRAIVGQVASGARVIVATSTRASCDSDHTWDLVETHLPSLLTIDRDAFVSTVFSADGMQPIRWRPNIRGSDRPNLVAPSLDMLEKSEGWRTRYEYLALQGCLPGQASIQQLLPIAHSDTWQLYEIEHSAAAGPLDSFNRLTSGSSR
jgi:hypothetical protein